MALQGNAEKTQTCLRKAVKFNLAHLDTFGNQFSDTGVQDSCPTALAMGGGGNDTYKVWSFGTHTVSVDHLQEHHLGSWWERHVPGYPRPVAWGSASQPDPQVTWVHIRVEKHWYQMQPPSSSLLCVGAQSHLTLFNSTNCSPPGSSVHEIFQARILEWVAIPSSRGSSWPRDQTRVSCISCIGR